MATDLVRIDGVEELTRRVQGAVMTPGDAGYDLARGVWNARFDRRPAAIVRPVDSAGVSATVTFARERGLPIAVRGGGHSLAGFSVADGAVVIDLGAMRGIEIDPVQRTAWAQTGLTSNDYARAAQPFGLATSTGDTGTVGLGGLTTGGGIGWMVRKHGLTIDHLLAADVVLADGRRVRASEHEHPDLFWALRGGGGAAGIVTALKLRLEPAGVVLGGGVIYPFAEMRRVLEALSGYAAQAPDELTVQAIAMTAPPAPFIPANRVGEPVISLFLCYTGDLAEGERVVAPLRSLGTPIADIIAPMPYPALFDLFADAAAPGFFHNVRSGYLDRLDDDTIATIIDHSARSQSPFPRMQLRVLGGAMSRVAPDATAFAFRDKPFMVTAFNVAADAESFAQGQPWLDACWEDLRPKTSGAYVNFLADEGEARVRDAYPSATLARLAKVKAAYDPENTFRFNHQAAARP
jgi:FAD/FMN-containing dehydrogenase